MRETLDTPNTLNTPGAPDTATTGDFILAIDFDDTIVDTDWPHILGLREDAKEVINRLFAADFQIRIWTCRAGDHLTEASVFLAQNGINFHGMNTNCPVRMLRFGNDPRKIGADIYIDDRGIMGIPPWREIERIVWREYKLAARRK